IMLLEADNRLVVRAAKGIDELVWRGLRIRVGEGFGGRVAEQRRLLVVSGSDAAQLASPALRELGLAALMGAPLMTDGRVIGVMHVGSFSEREFTDEEKRLLGLVADRAALAIDHARLYEHEHGIAETLQRSLLPLSLPSVPGMTVAARYLPARAEAQVGGDWYDVVPLDGGGLALSIGDVSGHGVEAASLMGRVRDALRAAAELEHRRRAGPAGAHRTHRDAGSGGVLRRRPGADARQRGTPRRRRIACGSDEAGVDSGVDRALSGRLRSVVVNAVRGSGQGRAANQNPRGENSAARAGGAFSAISGSVNHPDAGFSRRKREAGRSR